MKLGNHATPTHPNGDTADGQMVIGRVAELGLSMLKRTHILMRNITLSVTLSINISYKGNQVRQISNLVATFLQQINISKKCGEPANIHKKNTQTNNLIIRKVTAWSSSWLHNTNNWLSKEVI